MKVLYRCERARVSGGLVTRGDRECESTFQFATNETLYKILVEPVEMMRSDVDGTSTSEVARKEVFRATRTNHGNSM